jgi:integrase
MVAQYVAAAVEAPRRARREMKTFSPHETHRFLEAAKVERLEALYTLAVTAGLRQGELLGLRWRDVDLLHRSLRITGSLQSIQGEGLRIVDAKTGRSRRQVVVSEIATDALRRHRALQAQERLKIGEAWDDQDLVFTTADGKPIHPSNMLRGYRAMLRRAELPPLRFHDLRHTAATLLLGAGIHPKVVSEMLGHSTISITLDLYSHVTPTMQQQAADAVDSLLGCQIGCQTGSE